VDQGAIVRPPRWIVPVILLSLAALYWDFFGRIAQLWWNYDYAGHGMFVPLFSAVIAIGQYERLVASADRGRWAGLGIVVIGLGIFAAGTAIRSLVVEGLSVPVVVAGLVVLAFGVRTLREAAFAVAFLALMVPLPQPAVDAVTTHLQIFAAIVAGGVLGLFGIPFLRNGDVIELAGLTLQVAEACNGVRFLLGVVVLTLAYAEVTQRRLWRKAALAAAAIPAAVLANAVRVAGISTAAHFYGAEALGTPHLIIGKIVWIGTIVGLVLLGLAIRRVGTREPWVPHFRAS